MLEGHIDFFVDATEDGVSPLFNSYILDWGLFALGEFGGATVQLEISPSPRTPDPDDMKWIVHPNGVFDDEDYRNADLCDCTFRARIQGATGTTNITFVARPRIEKTI